MASRHRHGRVAGLATEHDHSLRPLAATRRGRFSGVVIKKTEVWHGGVSAGEVIVPKDGAAVRGMAGDKKE
jgi:hypothetical protein